MIRRTSGKFSGSLANRGGDICSVALKIRSRKRPDLQHAALRLERHGRYKDLRTLCEVGGPHHSRRPAADDATACLYLFDSLSGLIHPWMFIYFTSKHSREKPK